MTSWDEPRCLAVGLRQRMERTLKSYRGREWGIVLVKLNTLHNWYLEAIHEQARRRRVLPHVRTEPFYARLWRMRSGETGRVLVATIAKQNDPQ